MRWHVRGLLAAGVGVGLVLGWWGLASWQPRLILDLVSPPGGCRYLTCRLTTGFAAFMLTVILIVSLSMIIGWLVLHALRVRPAWPPALLGPVLGGTIAFASDPILPTHPFLRNLVPVAIGYAFVAMVSTPRRTPQQLG